MSATALDPQAIHSAATRACGSIMPAWPLDQAVAVNPHWRRIGMPIRHVAARLAVLGDFRVFPARDYIRQEWEQGRITHADLEAALKIHRVHQTHLITAGQCIAELRQALNIRRVPLLVDLLDDAAQRNRRWPWKEAIVFQISQACATYFDRHQAEWRASGSASLYGFWRESMTGDHGLGARLGLPGFMKHMQKLPLRAEDAMRWALDRLSLQPAACADYFEALLLSINGWSAWCAYIGWQKEATGQEDPRLRELLACRLAWEALLACAVAPAERQAIASFGASWQQFNRWVAEAENTLAVDELWQQALEASFQRGFAHTLRQPVQSEVRQAPEVQTIFCIDTRSELMRRALESIWQGVQTRAYAGSFGLPIHYSPLGTAFRRAQTPGLGHPSLMVQDVMTAAGSVTAGDAGGTEQAICTRQHRLARLDQWLGAVHWPNTTFSFVETAGIGYLGKIARWIRPPAAFRANADHAGLPARLLAYSRPKIIGLDAEKQADLAAGILRTMGLVNCFAPLVVLCGHTAQTANNAHASTLKCGACAGHSGEANVRALALMLNDSQVRASLSRHQIDIPDDTIFMGALHNTTTDEVMGFDLDLLSPVALARWKKMERAFAKAGDRVRRERASALWMDPSLSPEALLKCFRRRANDGAQTRPEWGLTRNAAFIIGPRERSRNRALSRAYLHDYDPLSDDDGSVLEQLMMGPMLVTHWLSWQYHASTCDPLHYGAGNKVLHNVVAGHIGVFEGNGGDLRIGLPRQSLHNGQGWYHQPVRLTVVIDAPAASIERAINRNPVLQQLFNNGWMLLWRYEEDGLLRYEGGKWERMDL